MAVLWYLQARIHDASHVDVAWAVPIACTAILYALLADGDVKHRVLAAALASLWGSRLGGYLHFNEVLVRALVRSRRNAPG
jgi:steroid 5-alpha reductase family enzyme